MYDDLFCEIGKTVIAILIKNKIVNPIQLRNHAILKIYNKLRYEGEKAKDARKRILDMDIYSPTGKKVKLSERSLIKIIYELKIDEKEFNL